MSELLYHTAVARYRDDYVEMEQEADPTYIMHWGDFYANAWRRVNGIAAYHDVLGPITVAKILAVTSPRMPWGRNLGVTDRIVGAWARWPNRARNQVNIHEMLNSLDALGLFYSRRAAVANAIENPTYVPTGQKVNAFYHNIIGDWSAVTIDAWMLKPFGALANKTNRENAALAITTLAAEVDKPPAVVQAELWGWYRRDSGWRKHDPDQGLEPA